MLDLTQQIGFGGGRDTGDQFFSSVVLLLHMDGSDASTTFTDSSNSAHTATANGDAQIDTAIAKFGTAGGLFDGTGDYLSIPDNADWNFGSGDFTIEGWVYPTTLASRSVFYAQEDDVNTRIRISYEDATNGAQMVINNGGTTLVNAVQGNNTGWTVNTWHHVAVVRNGSSFDYYLNGTSIISGSSATAFPDVTSELRIGASGSWTTVFYMQGSMDEWRVTKGVARYTGSFTPPSAAFPDS